MCAHVCDEMMVMGVEETGGAGCAENLDINSVPFPTCAPNFDFGLLEKNAFTRATSPERPLEPTLGSGNGSATAHEPFPMPRVGSNSTVLRASPSPVFLK